MTYLLLLVGFNPIPGEPPLILYFKILDFCSGGVTSLVIHYVYREVNCVVDWVISFVAQHSSNIIWTCMESTLGPFRIVLFSDFVGCIILDLNERSILSKKKYRSCIEITFFKCIISEKNLFNAL